MSLMDTAHFTSTVIVSGGSGFIGKACVKYLRQKGLKVLVAGRHKNADIFCDLSQPESVTSLQHKLDFDAFVHLGALVDLGKAALKDMYTSNVLATAIIADIVSSRNAFLLFSSSAIVSGLESEEIDNTSPLMPDTPYGQSKALAERCIQASGANACILRIGGVFGMDGPQHLGLNRAISQAITGKAPELYGDGSGRRNYIYVDDLASIVAKAVEQRKIGTHCVAGREALTIKQMISSVCNTFGIANGPTQKDGDSSRWQLLRSSPEFTGQRSFDSCLREIRLATTER